MRNPYRHIFDRPRLTLGALVCVAAGQLALADPQEPAATQDEPISTPGATARTPTGLEVYNEICVACHAPPGVGGAPALGDSDAWAPRLAQGMDTLVDHALNGYSGSTGIMPRKGGRVDLSDKEITVAIEYMVEQIAD